MFAGLVLVGINHKMAAVELRERLACPMEHLGMPLQELSRLVTGVVAGDQPDCEIAWLSTCNRTEVYLYAPDATRTAQVVAAYLARRAGMSQSDLAPLLYTQSGAAVVEHILTVAAGLDSLVLGENEILGQVKTAYETARQAGTTGSMLAELFRQAICTGKRVRSQTEIGRASRSVASMVVILAEDMFGSLADRTALLVGAGKISSMTARALVAAGLRCVLVANRTFDRAARLARSLGCQHAEAVHFDLLGSRLREADIVICSTGAPHVVLHAPLVAQAMQARSGRSLLVADLAVPRDVEATVGELPGVRLVDIDDLDVLVQTRFPLSVEVRAAAEAIVAGGVEEFRIWCAERRHTPLIRDLRDRAERICQYEVEHTLRRMGEVTPEQRRTIEAMGQAIIAKMLHPSITCLKASAGELDAEAYDQVVRQLFGLN